MGGRAAFEHLRHRLAVEQPAAGPALEIDLASGLERAMREIDDRRPPAVSVHYRAQPVGVVPSIPGAEALRGEHLRASLARALAAALLAAMGRAGAVPVAFRPMVSATGPLPAASLDL